MGLKIVPVTLKTANAYVAQYHRHHKPCVGCKFCIGVELDEQLVGVAICGRPVSRYLDDPCEYEIAEIHKNVTVEVIRCRKCGHTEISWRRQDNTEDKET